MHRMRGLRVRLMSRCCGLGIWVSVFFVVKMEWYARPVFLFSHAYYVRCACFMPRGGVVLHLLVGELTTMAGRRIRFVSRSISTLLPGVGMIYEHYSAVLVTFDILDRTKICR